MGLMRYQMVVMTYWRYVVVGVLLLKVEVEL
jgi:hypothetical protein